MRHRIRDASWGYHFLAQNDLGKIFVLTVWRNRVLKKNLVTLFLVTPLPVTALQGLPTTFTEFLIFLNFSLFKYKNKLTRDSEKYLKT